MKLLVLNKVERNIVRGQYKKGYILEPIEIALNIYILNYDRMVDIKVINNPVFFNKWFIIGDGSAYDILYQEFLNNQPS